MFRRTLCTGSTGNCFIVGKNLVDLGITQKSIKQADKEGIFSLSDVKYVFLTHIHEDHINLSTVIFIHTTNKSLKFVCPSLEVKKKLLRNGVPLKSIVSLKKLEIFKTEEYIVSPFSVPHDAENYGYWFVSKKHKHIHITDVGSLRGVSAKGFDSATIEANHCIDALNVKLDDATKHGEYSHLKDSKKHHLSVQDAIAFVEQNSIKDVEFVHISDSTREAVMSIIKKRM